MKKRVVLLLCMAVMLMLASCVANVPDDSTAETNLSTISTTVPATEPTTAPTETYAPTEAATTPTEPAVGEPRQAGLRLQGEELEYFEELCDLHYPPPVENYYNLALNQNFASVQDINLARFFEDGSPVDAEYEITDSEWKHYCQSTGDTWSKHNIDRLSYAFVTDVLQRYLGLTIPQMNMSTLVYNPDTGYYYRAGSDVSKYGPLELTDGYYDEETGLVSLYYMSTYPDEERIITLRYKPEEEVAKFQIVSCLPAE